MNGRFPDRMEKLYRKIPSKLIESLYLIAFAFVLIYDYNFLTRFERSPFRVLYVIGTALAAVVLLFRFLNIKNERRILVFFAVVILLIGGLYLLVRKSFYFLVLAILIVGSLKLQERQLLLVYILIATLFFSAMLVHFLLTNSGWRDQDVVHFGSINPTDCQAMIFFILVAFLFYKGTQIKYTDLIVMGAIVLWFWSHTHAEMNMFCSLACLIIAGCMKAGYELDVKPNLKFRQIIGYILSASFLVCAAAMIGLSIYYNPENEMWSNLNLVLHKRLACPHKMILEYPPKLFGSEFVLVGGGYEPGVNYQELFDIYGTTYIDSSYPQILVNYGYLVFAMMVGTISFVSARYARKGELYKVLLLAVIAVDCAAEGHLREISCNVWLVFPFVCLDGEASDRAVSEVKRHSF